tara:strand:+ start:1700 stop:2575 length:876 start_codon:yes stop_codon:yes gene_type:complete
MSLSVIVPSYNEEKSIKDTIEQLKTFMLAIDNYEIIVIDDNSTDMTRKIIESFKDINLIKHDRNKGYGASIKSGIREAKYDIIAITDADGTYPNEKIPQFYNILVKENLDMIVGSRTGSNVNIPVIRKPAKWFIGKLAEYIVNQKIPDINSGLRLFKKSSFINFLPIIPNGFSLTTTITLGMISSGYKLQFYDIDYFKRSGKSKIRPIRDTFNFFNLILRIGLYFAPLKIFIPISIFLITVSVLWGIYTILIFGKLADVSSLIIAMTGLNIAIMAFVAELINHRMPNSYKK